ncbi:MAG: hypothetical protein BGO67_03065 [Alphaproteobacteria bacterium 41-28]|nr:MAG: hypothetical protein BGO67_03065 [Alphaproteobacteria bacterium 41-28]
MILTSGPQAITEALNCSSMNFRASLILPLCKLASNKSKSKEKHFVDGPKLTFSQKQFYWML